MRGIMAAIHSDLLRADNNEPGSRTSSVPLLEDGFLANSQSSTNNIIDSSESGQEKETQDQDPKTGKRKFWGLGKKKEEPKKGGVIATTTTAEKVSPVANITTTAPMHPPIEPSISSASWNPSIAPTSPSRVIPSSPRIGSPASSQIFERNVQEDGLYASASPAIPAHITTENHIPSVLDASSVAITDSHLDPDNVEIVMHAAHQPAAVTVTGAGISDVTGTSWQEDLVAHPDTDDAASNYGALDSTNVKRLSFISFADVVHAEHAQADAALNQDSLHLTGSHSFTSAAAARSPSPIRSAVSPTGRSSSPRIGSPSFRGLETSPNRGARVPGSPLIGHSPPAHTGSELTIETMRQALRKTGSGDLSGARSQPMSAVGSEEGHVAHGDQVSK